MSPRLFSHKLQVRWGDVDRLGHVNNARIVEYFQESRAAFLQMDPLAINVVTRRMTFEFVRPIPAHEEKIDVSLSIGDIGRTSFTVLQRAFRPADAVCATSEVVLVAFDAEAGAARPLTRHERAHLIQYVDTGTHIPTPRHRHPETRHGVVHL
ncbi:acyl-CoA thioester hydrolase [Herbihabitans rhizosphaerae]|uniref:Acyl-CoA thioester hydrolase n=1 Tax=Herbihabitans rhizosphaerae TaxID=1872711 RepID=A0A4V2EU57_9PSEU|nr:acyl-CoA thioesterase [Herbihabitans rhizosphaerae]RZS43413.1 acyl-CoA thioester hydrolase [Herbihabitans rhizosphaerae]